MAPEPSYILSWIIARLSPFIAFGLGVVLSVHLGLNGNVRAKHVYLMSIPVGLLTTGNILSISEYNFMDSLGKFCLFAGTMMFYGTLVPQLFDQARRGLEKDKKTNG